LQFTPPEQPVGEQVTWHVVPLQLTACGHAFRPEQVTVFLAATVEIPFLHEPLPLHVMVHWSPEQDVPWLQLFWPLHVICETEALLVIPPPQAPSAHERMHWLPPHLTAPAQAPATLQEMSQDLPCEQSTPPLQPLSPQVTLQACSSGHVTTPWHEPWALQSKVHRFAWYTPP